MDTENRGRVRVEDVRVDDRVAPPPGHEDCKAPQCGRVVRLFRNTTDQVVTITAVARPRARERRSAGGEEQGGEEDAEPPSASQTIRCTPGHPFFVEGRGWIFAGDLREGDAFEARGEWVVVATVVVEAERAQTFNFEVACHHTYRVAGAEAGEAQPAVLVHNRSIVSAFKRYRARGGKLAVKKWRKKYHRIRSNYHAGVTREATFKKLAKRNLQPGERLLSQRTLVDSTGGRLTARVRSRGKMVDRGRRLDFVKVDRHGSVTDSIEITSFRGARRKGSQRRVTAGILTKNPGGTFVRDPRGGGLIPYGIPERVVPMR